MTNRTTNHLSDLATYVIRPALVEAHLITEKHARDAVYVTTLAEELFNIEKRILTLEQDFHLGPSSDVIQQNPCVILPKHPNARWIRTKSDELEARLRRIEQSFPGETPDKALKTRNEQNPH